MAARSINRKLVDIADAAHESGAPHSDQYGTVADQRVERLTKQIEVLAALAIKGELLLTDARMIEVLCSPKRDEILSEALVGAWDKVRVLCDEVFRAADAAVYGATPNAECDNCGKDVDACPCGPMSTIGGPTTPVITLEPRDRNNPANYPCCGGLRVSRTHTSNCRA